MIENVAHFIWFGESLPWLHVPALCSAVDNGGFERAILHHSDVLIDSKARRQLEAKSGVELKRLEPEALLGDIPRIGPQFVDLLRGLTQPAARANVVRAALLHRFGGVYLDTDTVCVGSFTDLLDGSRVFCGEEPVCVPAALAGKLDPVLHAQSLAMQAVREAFRLLPGGWRSFRKIEPVCWFEVNNAVFAAEAGHPFTLSLLEKMVSLPTEIQTRRYALGTHLLQAMVTNYEGNDLRVYPPSYFYPLGPEISHHWFRRGTARDLPQMLQASTRLVHWYASVRTKKIVPRIDPEFVLRTKDDLAISRLVAPWADALER